MYGCVMRDSHGDIIRIKGGTLGHSDAIHVEIMGLFEILKLAKSKGVRGCIMEEDSLTVIS